MTTTEVLTSDELAPALRRSLRALLDDAFDGDFSDDDWAHSLGGRHVVVLAGRSPVAHGAVVERRLEIAGAPFRAGYVEAVATRPTHQRQGLGAGVMDALAGIIRRHFELGALATGRHDFYARLGWERWRGVTAARDGATEVRTTDDDDAVMVLRFGPSAGIDLRAPITCPARHGDDW